jgi:transposase-like protein
MTDRRRWTAAAKAELKGMWTSGEVSLDHIADHFGVTPQAISKRAKVEGFGRKVMVGQANRHPRIFKSDLQPLWDDLRLSIGQIAERLNSTEALVAAAAYRFGLSMTDDPAKARLDVDTEQVARLQREQAMNRLELAVARCGGRYREMAKIAEEYDATMIQVQQLWHRLRVAA